MLQAIKSRIRNLVITEKVTKFVAKVFLMTTISNFKNGDIVCLKHDMTKRFVVENNLVMNGRIQLSYFNEFSGVMSPALIEPKYLILAPKQEQFCSFK
ncbi:MAG: hypothetical protein IKU50_00030 [Bacteroidaceae bacterium]|nr:hypothetical protein [Bacteroidaceae bacterium]